MNDVVEARYYRMGEKESYRYVRIKRKQKKVGESEVRKEKKKKKGTKGSSSFLWSP